MKTIKTYLHKTINLLAIYVLRTESDKLLLYIEQENFKRIKLLLFA